MKTISKYFAFLPAVVVQSEYNYVLSKGICYDNDKCDYAVPGTLQGSFPNAQEKSDHVLINTARMFPKEFIDSPVGKYEFGTFGNDTTYDLSSGECGKAQVKPLWYHQGATEAARYKGQDDSCTDAGHLTCDCKPFGGDCSEVARWAAYDTEKNTSLGGEGLCGANMCYTDDHCRAMFEPESELIGIGFGNNEEANSVVNVYVTGAAPEKYPIPSATHYNTQWKSNKEDYDANSQMKFRAIFYSETLKATGAFVAYQGAMIEIPLLYGDNGRGVFEYSTKLPIDRCEPYYFVFTTTDGQVRLPENENYFFGTSFPKYKWNKEDIKCDENHYFFDGSDVLLHGGPGVKAPESEQLACIGCEKVSAIRNLSPKSTTETTTESATESATESTTQTTAEPTAEPTTQSTTEPPVESTTDEDPLTHGPEDQCLTVANTNVVQTKMPAHLTEAATPPSEVTGWITAVYPNEDDRAMFAEDGTAIDVGGVSFDDAVPYLDFNLDVSAIVTWLNLDNLSETPLDAIDVADCTATTLNWNIHTSWTPTDSTWAYGTSCNSEFAGDALDDPVSGELAVDQGTGKVSFKGENVTFLNGGFPIFSTFGSETRSIVFTLTGCGEGVKAPRVFCARLFPTTTFKAI